MKKIILSTAISATLLFSLVCSCTGDDTECPYDGDIDSLESDAPGETSENSDAEDTGDPLCYSRAQPEFGMSGDEEVKSAFKNACTIENSSGYYTCCNQLIEFLSGNGDSDGVIQFCEESSCIGITDILSVWPGPGFGLGMVGDGASIPTGWQTVDCQGDPEIVWTYETKAAIADRTPDDTDCATITDAFTCATTHNPPAHCAMSIGWKIRESEEEYENEEDYLAAACTRLKEAVFIGCHQEYELGAKKRLSIDSGEFYTGIIRNKQSGECLRYGAYEKDIPDSWEKSDGTACSNE